MIEIINVSHNSITMAQTSTCIPGVGNINSRRGTAAAEYSKDMFGRSGGGWKGCCNLYDADGVGRGLIGCYGSYSDIYSEYIIAWRV